jgi:soluble lytic murein transglycosylase-like protein
MIVNKIFLCLALSNLSNTEFNMKNSSLKTACAFSKQIVKSSKENNISPFVFTSMIWVESRFQKNAVSHMGACGLTQVLSKYSKYTCKNLKKPKVSITEGSKILSFWYKKKKNIQKALECYNSGYRCNSPAYSNLILRKSIILKNEYNKVLKQLTENNNE